MAIFLPSSGDVYHTTSPLLNVPFCWDDGLDGGGGGGAGVGAGGGFGRCGGVGAGGAEGGLGAVDLFLRVDADVAKIASQASHCVKLNSVLSKPYNVVDNAANTPPHIHSQPWKPRPLFFEAT